MKKTRTSLTKRKGLGLKQNQTSSQRKPTSTNLRVMSREYFSEHGQYKRQQGTEGHRESDGRTDSTG